MDIRNGGLSHSEAFNLEEIASHNGTQFSNITMTLYKVHSGNSPASLPKCTVSQPKLGETTSTDGT